MKWLSLECPGRILTAVRSGIVRGDCHLDGSLGEGSNNKTRENQIPDSELILGPFSHHRNTILISASATLTSQDHSKVVMKGS